jgi:hypothetical protein
MQFWSNDPTILLNKDYMFEFWPTESMCYEQKLNAISRTIIVFTIFGFLITMSFRILVVGLITLGIIYVMWSQKAVKTENNSNSSSKEGFKDMLIDAKNSANNSDSTTNPVTLETVLKTEFYQTNKKNPLSNVLLTEIMDNPERKAAPPSFNPDVAEDITKATKKTVQYLNPGIKNTNKQLFGSLTDEFYLDRSNRAFISTANTKIPNDQGAFANFLYGDMPSCKDGDGIQCVKDNYRYTLY